MQFETTFQTNMNKQELEDILDYASDKLRYKTKRSIHYINKFNEIISKLNHIPSIILSNISSHKFYIIIRDITRDLLIDWYLSKNLIEEEIYLLRNNVLFFNHLINTIDDVTKLTSLLINSLFINSLANCMSDIDRLILNKTNKQNIKQLIRLFDVFSIYYERLPIKFQNEHGLDRLFESTMDCLASTNYDRIFRKLKSNSKTMTYKQTFFLINCPSFISSYHGLKLTKIIEQILSTMIPRYAFLLDKHIQTINQWESSIIHAIQYLLLTVHFARGYYTPYATGQPLQWLIDHIIRMISETSLTNKVNEKDTYPETILIESCLRTLTAFVYEPDLLAYIKYLKITSIFRSLILLPNESIVLHAYVMLSYTLEEDDIKASEKDSGRLLTKIFDALRKKMKILSIKTNNEDMNERNISLLVEALQALVQHDQIKSEILKQNALSLLIEGYQYVNNRSKRLLLESLGSITFDEEAARLLRENTQFINSIKDMQTTTTDDGINKAAERIIWNLIKEPEREKETKKKTTESKEKKKEKPKKEEYQYDIMISYCHADKELVYRIHKFLSDQGFKIWFDRDNIYGPAMQAMADAVENSEFVILCISDSYKRSVYCQAEAEYAFHCKRHLLPVIVRQGYRADGWLGLIIGSRVYVDFGRVEFKNACNLILKEITLQRENKINTIHTDEKFTSGHTRDISYTNQLSPLLREPSIEPLDTSKLPKDYLNRNTNNSTYRINPITQWTRKDVLDFLFDMNLHYMMPVCELMTGLGLIKLFRICQTKPNKFYQQLNDELSSRFNGLYLPIGIFTQFLCEMDLLISSASIHDIEQDALQSKTISPSSSSSVPAPLPSRNILKQPSDPTALLISSRKPSLPLNSLPSVQHITTPSLTTVKTLRNVQISEQTAYQKEPLNEQIPSNQPINLVPYRRTSFSTQSAQKTVYP